MDRSGGEGETLEEHIRGVHCRYLTALIRLEALEGEGGPAAGMSEYKIAEVEHELQFQLLRVLLEQLGCVPTGLTKRSEIEREHPAPEVPAMAGRSGPRPGRPARVGARAGISIRSA